MLLVTKVADILRSVFAGWMAAERDAQSSKINILVMCGIVILKTTKIISGVILKLDPVLVQILQ